MQTKTALRYRLTSTRLTVIKHGKEVLARVWINWNSLLYGANGKWHSHCAGPQKITWLLTNSFPGYLTKRIEHRYSNKYLYMNIWSHTIHNIVKVETTQMTISWWMAKRSVVYPCNGILFDYKKEWWTDTCYYRDNPWKHYTKWKKLDAVTGFIWFPCPSLSRKVSTIHGSLWLVLKTNL